MKLTSECLKENDFKCDVEMNLSTHFWKDDSFEIVNFEGMDFERECDWQLIIFGKKIKGYGGVRLIADVDDVDKLKQLLMIYDINPNEYFK